MERHHRKAKTAANAGISLSVKREDLRTKYVTHQDSDILPVANNKLPKLESNRPPLRQLLTEKENKQKPISCRTRKLENEEQLRLQTDKKEQEGQERQAKIRQGEAGKAKAASTPTNQALPRAYVVLKPLTREEIEALAGPSRHQDKKERHVALVPVAGPSSLNTTVTLPSSLTANYQITPELVTKKGNNYDIGDVRSNDSTDDDTRPKKSIPAWARIVNLKEALNEQANQDLDFESLFPAEVLRCGPDLNEIFKIKRDRFDKRTSSAIWKTPPSNYM